MPEDERELDHLIEALLADPAYEGHPLRDALARLHERSVRQLAQIERIAHISDGYQHVARDDARSLAERYERELKRIEKLTRISDRYQSLMRDENMALLEASTHDHLTGLANRRYLTERLRVETERSLRTGSGFAVVMLDVDHFKRLNDQHGHEVSDKVLVALARIIESVSREYDVSGRWGGEEFMVLLPETGMAEASSTVLRLLDAIRAMGFDSIDAGLAITASAGATIYVPGESYEETVHRADMALFEAKAAGRDCFRLGTV